VVRVQKVVARAGLDAEQQVLNGVAQGGFAGLVGPDDKVKILIGPGRVRDRSVNLP
jgi:hypothetical protein